MTDPTNLTNSWCRAWNDEPALINDLVTDDVRMWLGSLGTIEKRTELASFVTRFRESRGTRFTTQLLMGDDEGLAYVWLATQPDGVRQSGLDVWSLQGERVAEVWSIAGDRTAGLPLDETGEKTDRARMIDVVANWLPLWNGNLALADDLLTDDFRIWFGTAPAGDAIDGPAEFAAFVGRYREGKDERRFDYHRPPVIDEDHGRAAFTWSVTDTGLELGGIDVFQFRDGRIAQVWSVTGTVAF